MSNYIEAEFLEESQGRFLGKVIIEGKVEECYISSSSKLGKYIDLKRKKVLLESTLGKNTRTKYKLFAVEHENNYILLNLNESNEILEQYFIKMGIKENLISREFQCDNGLKTDLKIGSDQFIEVKTVISCGSKAVFPGEYSERFIRQLKQYQELLSRKCKVELAIMLFNEQTKDIVLNNECVDACKEMASALDKGMKIGIYKAIYKDGKVEVIEESDCRDKLVNELNTNRWKGSNCMDALCFTECMNNYESKLDENFKKNNGIFYTDLFLADKMVKSLHIKKKDVIMDPCCGTGSFVMTALSNGYKNVYGIDQDAEAITVCKKTTDNDKLMAMDTLGVSGDVIRSALELKEKVDFIIGNPPYAPLGDGVSIDSDTAFLSKVINSGSNLFVAALYRAFELVKEEGIISYIIPKNFLHVMGYSELRKYILNNKTIVSIVDLGMYFKKVRGEQIVITIKNVKPKDNSKIQLLQLVEAEFVKTTLIAQKFYEDEILLFRSSRDVRIYKNLTTKYDKFDDVCEGYVGRGKSKSSEAIIGKEIRKFGYKNHKTPKSGNQIFIQNIYSAEAGVIAAFGGDYEASQTVTVFTDGEEENCRYMLGILHSKLCNFFLFKYCYNNSRLTMHTDAKYLKKIPLVKYGTKTETNEVVEIVKKIEKHDYMSEAWFDSVQELDEKVFKLFKLTALDAKFITEEMQKIQSKRWMKDVK